MKSPVILNQKVDFNFQLRHKFIQWLNNIDIKGFRKIAFWTPKILIPRPTNEGILQLPSGLKLWIDPVIDNGVERSLYFTGSYEAGTLNFIEENLSKGGTFLDVGANIGLMSLVASKVVGDSGHIISFEPHPVTADILRSNIQLNNIKNIEVVEKGIGNTNKITRIHDRWDVNRGGATILESHDNDAGYPIELVRLDDVLTNRKIDLIKIDVEGFELEVLKGAKKLLSAKNPPTLIVECTAETENENYSRQALFEWIKNTNGQYRFFKLKGSKSRVSKLVEVKKINELPTHDNLFCQSLIS